MQKALVLAAGLVLSGQAVAEPVHNWSGIYAGVNVGAGFGSYDYSLTTQVMDYRRSRSTDVFDLTAFGLQYGAQVGYNHAFGPVVLGIEADFQFTDVSAYEDGYIGYEWDHVDLRAGTNVHWFATLRPRLGVIFDRVMLYGTGGLAVGRMEEFIQYLGDEPERIEANEEIKPGWVAGGGVEYAMTDRLRLKGEYLFTSFERRRLGRDVTVDRVRAHSDIGFHAVRLGLNWAF